jgi:hypothetical protein
LAILRNKISFLLKITFPKNFVKEKLKIPSGKKEKVKTVIRIGMRIIDFWAIKGEDIHSAVLLHNISYRR